MLSLSFINMKAIKELGQHFLNDPSVASNIADLGRIQAGERIWEIGPGPGILTQELLDQGAKLETFELDRRMAGILEDRFGEKLSLTLIDILRLDWQRQLDQGEVPLKLIANIPYQITSPLLYKIEAHASSFSRIVLMIQQEVADRLSAVPGKKSFGPLTLRLGVRFDIHTAFKVGKEFFDPVPKVDSAVIVMTPRKDPANISHPSVFYELITSAFAHRRKTLRNNLIPMIGRDGLSKLEQASEIDFSRRAETLCEKDYILLSDLIADL